MKKYALYSKSKNQLKFIEDSLLMLNARTNKAFQNRFGMAAKGSIFTFEDFIKDFKRVEIEITPIESGVEK